MAMLMLSATRFTSLKPDGGITPVAFGVALVTWLSER
jgi:hypothetical protein